MWGGVTGLEVAVLIVVAVVSVLRVVRQGSRHRLAAVYTAARRLLPRHWDSVTASLQPLNPRPPTDPMAATDSMAPTAAMAATTRTAPMAVMTPAPPRVTKDQMIL